MGTPLADPGGTTAGPGFRGITVAIIGKYINPEGRLFQRFGEHARQAVACLFDLHADHRIGGLLVGGVQ